MTEDRVGDLSWTAGVARRLKATEGLVSVLADAVDDLVAEVLRLRAGLEPLARGSTLRADRERGLGLLGAA